MQATVGEIVFLRVNTDVVLEICIVQQLLHWNQVQIRAAIDTKDICNSPICPHAGEVSACFKGSRASFEVTTV